MNRDRYLVQATGDNIEGTRMGLLKFVELCKSHGNGVIVVPQLQRLKSSMLVGALGDEIALDLIDKRSIKFEDGASISLCSDATLNNFKHSDVYLALWGSKHTIQKIEEQCYNWKAAVLVTWVPADSEDWCKENDVETIFDDQKRS